MGRQGRGRAVCRLRRLPDRYHGGEVPQAGQGRGGQMMRLGLIGMIFVSRSALASGGGSSGAEFLRVGMGARPAALGENFTGLADDVTTAVWNPAGLGQLDHVEISGMGLSYLAD